MKLKEKIFRLNFMSSLGLKLNRVRVVSTWSSRFDLFKDNFDDFYKDPGGMRVKKKMKLKYKKKKLNWEKGKKKKKSKRKSLISSNWIIEKFYWDFFSFNLTWKIDYISWSFFRLRWFCVFRLIYSKLIPQMIFFFNASRVAFWCF